MRKPRSYTQEERSRGGIKRAENARERALDAIDRALPEYVAAQWRDGDRVVLSHFIKEALPWCKNVKKARDRYGAYVKARLKEYEGHPAVMRLGEIIDAIRRGIAKRLEKLIPPPVFASMPGWLHRLSGGRFKTSNRFNQGAAWLSRLGCWGYFVSPDGECMGLGG